ncbi:MAG: VCBS repeat-containing protein [Albidovulum sp.]|uniref:FG-GAP repeat domain-containing protein n=1 Tax=Albidovulum sp. TaxID=1872424 RepID=UPI003C85C220
MPEGARRPLLRPVLSFARRALWPGVLWLVLLAPLSTGARDIDWARYEGPTGRYPHGALGDTIEHTTLMVRTDGGHTLGIRLPDDLVFEDTAPRIVDLDGDGTPEIIVVESHQQKGARLAVWALDGKTLTRRAATPFIGRRFRWLAPIGAADLDGDGRVEIAYVETPHLGKTLKIVRLEGTRLVPVAEAQGLTNHRIGDAFIQGRIATCNGRPTILTAKADWSRILGTILANGKLTSRDFARYRGADSFSSIVGCN